MTYGPIDVSEVTHWVEKRSLIASFLLKEDHGPWLVIVYLASVFLWAFLVAWIFLP